MILQIKKFRFFDLLILLLFAFTLTGCGSDTSTPSTTNTDTEVETDTDTATDANSGNSFYDQDTTVGTEVSSGDYALTTLTSANLRYDDESGNIRQLALTWEDAFTDNTSSTTYTICQTDDSQTNDCLALGTVIDTLSFTTVLTSVLDAVDQSYFVLANNGTEEATSSVKTIHAGEYSDIAGYFKASNTGASDDFGDVVVISGDGLTMAVAAAFEDSDASGIDGEQTDSLSGGGYGAVYIYSSDGNNNWSQTAYVKASNPDVQDHFGYSLALNEDGKILVVGAREEDSASATDDSDNTKTDAGAVYIYHLDTNNNWSQTAYLKNSTPAENDNFGHAVAFNNSGNRLAVGSAYQSSDTVNESGAVIIFDYNSTDQTWEKIAQLEAANPGEKDRFGAEVSLSADGKIIAVGAYLEDSSGTGLNANELDNTLDGAGAVYIFSEENDWGQTAYLKASNPGVNDYFGRSIALNDDGNRLVVGAYNEDSSAQGINGDGTNNNAKGSGAVYIFNYNDIDNQWSQTAYIKSSNSENYASDSAADQTGYTWGDYFGRAVTFNKEGNVLAVGAPYEDSSATGINWDEDDNTSLNSGAVYLFKYDNASSTWSQQAYIKAPNTEKDAFFGFSISLSSDGQTLAIGAKSESSSSTGVNGEYSNLNGTEESNEKLSGAVYLY